jgi:hypothetical protein
MLTVTNYENEVSNWNPSSQNDVPVTDAEVLQRVSRIRRGWSAQERVQRRREAERRFAELVEALADTVAA